MVYYLVCLVVGNKYVFNNFKEITFYNICTSVLLQALLSYTYVVILGKRALELIRNLYCVLFYLKNRSMHTTLRFNIIKNLLVELTIYNDYGS